MNTLLSFRCNAICKTINSFLSNTYAKRIVNNVALRNVHSLSDKYVNLIPNMWTFNSTSSTFLKTTLPIYNQTCGMKMKTKVQLRCKDCYFVRRRERWYVMCPTHPRHKQAQTRKKDYNTWILTSVCQSPKRPW